jgi:hypothetical protein
MIPNNSISSVLEMGGWIINKDDAAYTLTSGYELGADVYSSSTNASLTSYLWQYGYSNNNITLKRDDLTIVNIIDTIPLLTELSLTFDQNMNPYYTYVQSGNTYLKYYDSTTQSNTTVNYGFGFGSPKVILDYKINNSAASDVLFIYMKSNTDLCVRVQRERFNTEHVLKVTDANRILRVGMNTQNRLQFKMEQILS